jgi:exosome complex RNA-binding protein Rrp42 (RNase PH superfamily)
MYIVAKFYMGSELELAIELLKQDGRFDTRYVDDNRKVALNGIIVNLDFTCRYVDHCI